MPDLQVKTIRSMAEFEAISQEWTELLNSSAAPSFFLTWEWLYSWAKTVLSDSTDLFVLVGYENNGLMFVAPLYIKRSKTYFLTNRELRFLGTPETGSDYLDVITKKGCEQKAAEAVYNYLHSSFRAEWSQINFTDIRADSLFLLHFINRIEKDGKYYAFNRLSYCPVLELPQSEEQLYAGLSKGWRKKIKQDMRVLSRDYAIDHQTYAGPDAEQYLDVFFQHYQEHTDWTAKILKPVLGTFINQNQHPASVQLDFLYVDGTLRAALLHLTHKKTLAMFLMTVDKKFNPKISVGNVLVGRSILNAMRSGYAYYDFLKGDERYKFHWASAGQATVALQLWQKTLPSLVFALRRIIKNTGKLLLR